MIGRGAEAALVVAAPRVAEKAAFCLPPCWSRRTIAAARISATPACEGIEDHSRDRAAFAPLITLDQMRVVGLAWTASGACRRQLLPLELLTTRWIAVARGVVSGLGAPRTAGGAKV